MYVKWIEKYYRKILQLKLSKIIKEVEKSIIFLNRDIKKRMLTARLCDRRGLAAVLTIQCNLIPLCNRKLRCV